MPGRCKGMAKRATALETVVLNVFQRISAATPAIHKETDPRHGVSAPTSPWVAVHRLSCELLLATAELGEHYRKRVGIREAGPIRTVFSKSFLRRLRQKYQRTGGGRTLGELESLRVAALEAADRLPGKASVMDEATWAHLALYDPCPDFTKAPSQLAITLWFSLEMGPGGFANRFTAFLWRIRLRLEHRNDAAAAQRRSEQERGEEEQERRMARVFGHDWRRPPSNDSGTTNGTTSSDNPANGPKTGLG